LHDHLYIIATYTRNQIK